MDAVAVEGRNHESLAMASQVLDAGKHLWFDKPAGDDWPTFKQLLDKAEQRSLYLQMGYMFRYSPGFRTLAEYARSGALGDNRWHCGTEFLQAFMPRYSAVIHTLRHKWGYGIRGVPCDMHEKRHRAVFMFKITAYPADVVKREQMSWL